MTHSKFAKLIEGFCAASGLDEPEKIVQGGPVEVGDVLFSLVHNETANPDLVYIYCDFGLVPQGREAEIYRTLLETNTFLYSGSGPTFAISPDTRRVILVDHQRLDAITPKGLREHMIKMQEHAMSWRLDFFLSEKSRGAKNKTSGLAMAGALQAKQGTMDRLMRISTTKQ